MMMKAAPGELVRARSRYDHDHSLSDSDRLFLSAAEAAFVSKIPIVIEVGALPKPAQLFFIEQLIKRIEPQDGLRIIFNAYNPPINLPNNAEHYSLPPLSLRDAIAIIRSNRPISSMQDMEQVYAHYKGHALSIAAWAISNEPVEAGLPVATAERFRAHWSVIDQYSRELFCVLCKDPDLAIAELMPEKETNDLLTHGLLSCYPCAQLDGTIYYVHQLARELCYHLLPIQKWTAKRTKLLESALHLGKSNAGPRLVNAKLEAGERNAAGELLFEQGREWLESSGLRATGNSLYKASLSLGENAHHRNYTLYLAALTLIVVTEN